MKIALILPPMSLEERYGKAIAKVAGTLPPLGLLYLGAVLKKARHSVSICDGSKEDFASILNRLLDMKPDVIGITTMTFVWPKVKKIIPVLKKNFPKSFVVVGGVHATMAKGKCLEEEPLLDAVVYGEGENTIIELVERIARKDPLNGVKGIIFRDGSRIVENEPREVIENIDEIPFPARELVDISVYVPAFSQYKAAPVTNIITTRGCPYHCIFCIPDTLGKRVRFRSPENIIYEIIQLKSKYGIKDVAIWDDTFTLSKSRIIKFCYLLLEKKLGIFWSAQARIDCVDKELLELMAKAGCWKLHYGVETLVQKNLDTLKKGTKVEDAFNAIDWTKGVGMEVEASFIFGTPGETYNEGLKTISLSKKLNADYVRFFYFTPYDNLREKIRKDGRIISDDLSKFQGNEVVFVPNSMTKKELEKLVTTAYLKYYLRPRYITQRIRKMLTIRSLRENLNGFIALLFILKKLVSIYKMPISKT